MPDSTNAEAQLSEHQPTNAVYVPGWLRFSGAWGWRFVALSAALYVLLQVCMALWIAVLAAVLGAILAALLQPLAGLLRRVRVPRSIAGAFSVLFTVGVVIGALVLFGSRVSQEIDQLSEAVRSGYQQLVAWSANTLGVSQEVISDYVDKHLENLQSYAGSIAKQVLTRVQSIAEALTVLVVSLVFAWFFIWDGDEQFAGAVHLLPPDQRQHARALGERVWHTVGGYMRGMVVIATADALLLGLGLWLIGLPLVLPLMLLMFLGAFVPFVGPLLVGFMACLVALSNGGFATVGLVIVVSFAVQQIEGNLLHPFIMGRAVSLHPSLILFSITAGGVLAGIVGVFLAIPAAASAATVFGYIREQHHEREQLTSDLAI